MYNENLKKLSNPELTFLAEIPKLSERNVVDCELFILKAMDFNINITLPASLVKSLSDDYRNYCNRSKVQFNEEMIKEWERNAIYCFSGSFATLVLKPTLVAIFSLMRHEPVGLELTLDKYLDYKFSKFPIGADSSNIETGISSEIKALYSLVIERFGDPVGDK